LEGEIREDKRAPTGYEIQATKLKVIQFAEIFPINKDQSPELLLDNRHLWLRSRKLTSVLKIRSTIFNAIHTFFRNNNFYEFQSPIIQGMQAEGGSTLFELNYFGKNG
jgi:asparaginyl-tRNA synthetase